MRAPKDSYLKWWGLGALLVLTINLFLAGCATTQRKGYQAHSDNRKTVLVVNESLDQLAIYVQGSRIATVMSGRKECIYLPVTSENFTLYGRPLGGGVTRYSPLLNNSESWKWTLDNLLGLDGIAPEIIPSKPCK